MKPKLTNCLIAFFASAFQAFGMYNIHAVADITEGGVLGATLLLEHWLSLSPALTGAILNILCYDLGWRTMGKTFLIYSFAAAAGFSSCYWLCEPYPPLVSGNRRGPSGCRILGCPFHWHRRGTMCPGRRRHLRR